MKKKFIGFIFALILSINFAIASSEKVDLIIFSYDRPLQLFALLESIDKYIKGLGDVYLIYRTSSPEYDKNYDMCFAYFKHLNLTFIKQRVNDFKHLTIDTLKSTKHDYLFFAVDDIIVKDFISLSECATLLKEANAHGFYLRLGKHITKCHSEGNKHTPVPTYKEIKPGIYLWTFKDGQGDWGYPNTVDMTVYCKKEILQVLCNLDFDCPNVFEGKWAEEGRKFDMHKKGLFYADSKILNVPLNLVQTHHWAYNMNFPKEKCLDIFDKGFKVDINQYFKYQNDAPHIELMPKFVNR